MMGMYIGRKLRGNILCSLMVLLCFLCHVRA